MKQSTRLARIQLFALAFISLISVSTLADENKSEPAREVWTCTGYGTHNVGGPVGPIEQSVSGTGSTQLEAIQDLQSNCFSFGLNNCTVQFCSKR